MENRILLSVKDMTIGHDGRTLCSGITFDVCEGDCIMLCGANGSGKTTLMKTLANSSHRDLTYSPGRQIECILIPARIPKVAGFTLKEFVRVSCFSKSDLYGKLSPSEEAELNNAIEILGLMHLADRDISTLSDGEFQKAGIASALVRKADIIMLDEPTAFLDAENRISVLNTLRALCDQPQILNDAIHRQNNTADESTPHRYRPAIIFSTHDLYDGLAVCTKVFALGADRQFHTNADNTPESKSATVSRIFSR